MTRFTRFTICCLLLFIFHSYSHSQTGPGSVGTNDGLSNLKLWVRIDSGITKNGANQVSGWADLSGNNFHAAQSVLAKQPIWTALQVNGQPSLVLDGVDDAMGIQFPAIAPAFNSISHFMVYKLNGAAASLPLVFNNNVNITGQYWGFETNGWGGTNANRMDVLAGFGNDATFTTPGFSSTGNWKICSVISNTNIHNTTTRYNGMNLPLVPVGANVGLNFRLGDPAGSFNVIGGVAFGGHPYLNGEFAEIIDFNAPINTAQLNIIENYLSAKYNVALTANNFYSGDDPVNGDYDRDVMGIGRFSLSEQHIVSLDNNQGLNISDAGFISNDGDYLLYGHRNELFGWVNGAFGTCNKRWNRSFYLEKTDAGLNGGNLVLDFDFTDGDSPLLPDPSATYCILTGPGFATAVPFAGAMIVGLNTVRFNVNATDISSGAYTIGMDSIPAILSEKAILLQAITNEDEVVLNWNSIKDISVFKYRLMKSSDRWNYFTIAELPSQGNRQFQFIDRSVSEGSTWFYYVVAESDHHGYVQSSNYVEASLSSDEFEMKIFPNPSTGIFNIDLKEYLDLVEIEVYNLLGEIVQTNTFNNVHSFDIEIKGSTGVYFLKIKTDGKRQIIKLVKN